jgi:hypothetical protein
VSAWAEAIAADLDIEGYPRPSKGPGGVSGGYASGPDLTGVVPAAIAEEVGEPRCGALYPGGAPSAVVVLPLRIGA